MTEGGVPAWLPARRRGALLVSFRIPTSLQPEFNRWYNREHIPARLGLGPSADGFQATTRYLTGGEEPRYINLYELGAAEFLETPQYLAVRATEAQMPVVEKLSGEMRTAHPELFTRRIMRTWDRGTIGTIPGRMVLETVECADAGSREQLMGWAVPAYLGTAAAQPDVEYACVGLTTDDTELVFMTGFGADAHPDWTYLTDGVAAHIVGQVTRVAVGVDVCLPLARFTRRDDAGRAGDSADDELI